MKVVINGSEQELRDALSLAELINHLHLQGQPLAIELNRAVVTKSRFSDTTLSEGDHVEIISFVGGG